MSNQKQKWLAYLDQNDPRLKVAKQVFIEFHGLIYDIKLTKDIKREVQY